MVVETDPRACASGSIIGALLIIIRIGFGVYFTIGIIRNHQDSIGNY